VNGRFADVNTRIADLKDTLLKTLLAPERKTSSGPPAQ